MVTSLHVDAQLIRDDLAAGQHGDILQHGLAAIAKARSLDRDASERAAQLVDDQRRQRLALDVLSDYQQLLARLHDLLQHRQYLLYVGDLLIGDKYQRIVQQRFHLLGIGDHVRRSVAAVKLHAFYQRQLGLHRLGLLDGDNAIVADLLHSAGDQLADRLIGRRYRRYLRYRLGAAYRLGQLLELLDRHIGSLLYAAADDHRVSARGHVLQTLADHSLCQQRSSRGAVAGHVVGLGSDFLDQLRAHVLKRVFQLHILGYRHAVVGYKRAAVLLVQHNIAALGAQGYFNGVGQRVYAALQRAARFLTILYLLSHNICLPKSL